TEGGSRQYKCHLGTVRSDIQCPQSHWSIVQIQVLGRQSRCPGLRSSQNADLLECHESHIWNRQDSLRRERPLQLSIQFLLARGFCETPLPPVQFAFRKPHTKLLVLRY